MAILKDKLDVRNLNKYNILYVDDEEINLKVFKETFKKDYNVYTALSGREALQLIDEHKEIDMVITDQRMPEMSGTELLEKVVHKNPNMLRMIMTGHSDLEVIVKAVNEYGIDQYVTKPWDSKNLKDTLDNLLANYSKEILKKETGKATADDQENKMVDYAKTLINMKESKIELLRKYFPMPLIINYSKYCEGRENIFIDESRNENSVIFVLVNCTVNDVPGSLIKSNIVDLAKEYLLSITKFDPAHLFDYLAEKANEVTKKHFYDNIRIGLTLFFHNKDKKRDIVISNTHMIYGYKDDQPINPETMMGDAANVKAEGAKVYNISEDNCDKLYMYAIDTIIDKDIFEGNLLTKLEEGQEMSYGEQIISLQAFLNSSVSNSGVDKFSLIGLDYTIE